MTLSVVIWRLLMKNTLTLALAWGQCHCVDAVINLEFWEFRSSVQLEHNFLTSAMAPDSQLTFLANMTLANQWTLKLPASEAVHHLMTLDPSDSNYLYLMTSHHVSMWILSLWLMAARVRRTRANLPHLASTQHTHQIFNS